MSIRPGNPAETRNIFPRTEPEGRARDTHESVVDASSAFDGLFAVGHSLRIEGEAKGEIQCDGTLTVAEGARVSAKVSAANVVVAGTLEGNITCRERLQILPSGRVSGTVTTGALVIQEGALYEGELHMQRSPSTGAPDAPPAPDSASLPANRSRTATTNGRTSEPSPEQDA